jgi:hypothetical protein
MEELELESEHLDFAIITAGETIVRWTCPSNLDAVERCCRLLVAVVPVETLCTAEWTE